MCKKAGFPSRGYMKTFLYWLSMQYSILYHIQKNQTTKYMENSIKKTQDKVDWTDYPKEVIIQFRTASRVAERSGIKLTLKVQFAEGYGGDPEILPVQSNIIAISKVVDYAVIEEGTDANFADVFDINDVEVRNNKFGRISYLSNR